jgi:hypothetical protein
MMIHILREHFIVKVAIAENRSHRQYHKEVRRKSPKRCFQAIRKEVERRNEDTTRSRACLAAETPSSYIRRRVTRGGGNKYPGATTAGNNPTKSP